MFGEKCVCQDCGRHYIHDWHKGHTAKKCNTCRNAVWRDRRDLKLRMVEYKGGSCILCGYSRCLRALDFHHFHPEQKRFTIAQNHQRSWETLRAELDKCILVCSNCHIELESQSGRSGPRRDDPDADSTCVNCGRRFRYRRPGMTRSRCNSCCANRASPEARRQLKAWMVQQKGGACVLCGFQRHLGALTFHHVDPARKRFNIGGSHARSLTAIAEELKKCVLLCANCHDEFEDGAVGLPEELVQEIERATAHAPRYRRRPAGRPRLS